MSYVVPVIIVALLVTGAVKRVNVYNSFTLGAKEALPVASSVFPYVASVVIMVNLLEQSGVGNVIADFLAPLLTLFGIPKELSTLVFVRPFSGSGSLAVLEKIYQNYGVDSYVSRCASVLMGSSETVFYISAVYFADTPVKKLGPALPIALFCSFVGVILSCLLCKVM